MRLLLFNLLTICISAIPLDSQESNSDLVGRAFLFARSLEHQPISISRRLSRKANLVKRSEERSEIFTDNAVYQNTNAPLELHSANSYNQVPYVYTAPYVVPAGYAGPVIVTSPYGQRVRPAPRPVPRPVPVPVPAGYAPRPV